MTCFYMGMELEFGLLVFVDRGKPKNQKKNPSTSRITNSKLNPCKMPCSRFKPRSHLREASALTTAIEYSAPLSALEC